MLVVSYNPGYQSLLKALKPSTRQRFVAIEFGFLPPEQELRVVAPKAGCRDDRWSPLVRLAGRLRALKGQDLEEGVSTRLAGLLRQPDRGRACRRARRCWRHDRAADR